MNVASLELCKELYELSGWETNETEYWTTSIENYVSLPTNRIGSKICPAYDLGYLLRKLPPAIRVRADWLYLYIMPGHSEGGVWLSGYRRMWPIKLSPFIDYSKSKEYLLNRIEPSDTPEDAACKLAIELFKVGILTREREKDE